jgi:chromosome partitioning protein
MYHQVMPVIAVANLKGGCGKSTIAVNLACELARRRSSVVLVDADAQGTAAYWSSHGSLPLQCLSMPLDNVRDAERWAARVLDIKADYVVLDAPPHVGSATEAAVAIADLVLVPVTASGADLAATISGLDLIRQVRATRQDGGPLCLLIPSKIDRRTLSGREIESALKPFGEPIGPAIHQRAAIVDAFGAGQWIGDFAPDSAGHQDIQDLASTIRKRLKR